MNSVGRVEMTEILASGSAISCFFHSGRTNNPSLHVGAVLVILSFCVHLKSARTYVPR